MIFKLIFKIYYIIIRILYFRIHNISGISRPSATFEISANFLLFGSYIINFELRFAGAGRRFLPLILNF